VTTTFSVQAVEGLPEVSPGDDIAALVEPVLGSLRWPDGGQAVADGDILVVTSKVVSKAEGRIVLARDREQAITDETVRVVATVTRSGETTRIVENRQGLVMAAAGVDASNTRGGTVLLLPQDPDASARRIRAALEDRFGVKLGVLVTDTIGRPWRLGLMDLTIGSAGVRLLEDFRGRLDTHGKPLQATMAAVADEIASAVELVTGKVSGRPVAMVRGLGHLVTTEDGPGARSMHRPSHEDLFRLGSAEAYADGWRAGYDAALRDVRHQAGPPSTQQAPRGSNSDHS
jgi:coenzyme F420-0:L-glutamate ligase/coenzyme F420-1:gamma-L-glutamate ligase